MRILDIIIALTETEPLTWNNCIEGKTSVKIKCGWKRSSLGLDTAKYISGKVTSKVQYSSISPSTDNFIVEVNFWPGKNHWFNSGRTLSGFLAVLLIFRPKK